MGFLIGLILQGDAFVQHDELQYDYANQNDHGQDDELDVDVPAIDHDGVGAEGDNVPHADEVVGRDGNL